MHWDIKYSSSEHHPHIHQQKPTAAGIFILSENFPLPVSSFFSPHLVDFNLILEQGSKGKGSVWLEYQ